MLSRAKHKVQSQRGASLSMALMLALVVTTVTAVALTAATAVSGRYSQLADMDRSYYNTTSAAKLFWDKMGGNNGAGVTVTFVRGCDATLSGSSWTTVDGSQTLSIDNDEAFKIEADSPNDTAITLNSSNATLFQIVAADMLFTPAPTEGVSETRDYSCAINKTGTVLNENYIASSIDFTGMAPLPKEPNFSSGISYESFQIGPQGDNNPIKPLNVTLKCGDDGTFYFVFQEPDQENRTFRDATPFRCTLTAEMSVDDSEPRFTELGDNKFHIEWYTTVTWKVAGLATGGGTYAQTT